MSPGEPEAKARARMDRFLELDLFPFLNLKFPDARFHTLQFIFISTVTLTFFEDEPSLDELRALETTPLHAVDRAEIHPDA